MWREACPEGLRVLSSVGKCLASGWCDYSEEHARLRRVLEQMVEEYVRGSSKEYWLPVVVAPYGSGKTALLRHLEWFVSKKLKAPVLRTELVELIDYLISTRGTVHESELPRVVEEFFWSRVGGERKGIGVLLVDEVEEAYDTLRGVVEYETSPLRGVAEAIRTRRISVYVVLAFGPSSILKEAVFGPVAWRSRILTIPLLSKKTIARWVGDRVKSVDGRIVELVANTIWWASKGRIGWARMLVDTVAEKLVGAVSGGYVEDMLYRDEVFSREIVDGIPLLDRGGLREASRLAGNMSKLVPVLAALVGPVPLSVLEAFVGESVFPEANNVVVFGRSGARVEDVVGEAETWLARIARRMGVGGHVVSKAVDVLRMVLEAWSVGGLVLWEQGSFRELVSIAADVARELYVDEPAVYRVLEKLDPDLVAPETTRFPEPVAALKPSMVVRIYPLLTSSPLVGCARKASEVQIVEAVEAMDYDQLKGFSRELAKVVELDPILSKTRLDLVFVPASKLAKYAGQVACEALERPLVLVVAQLGGSTGQRIPPVLAALEGLGKLYVVEASGRLAVFLYSLAYNYTIPSNACKFERLVQVEKRSIEQHSELLKSLVLDKLASRPASSKTAETLAKTRTVLASLGDFAPLAWAIAGSLVEAFALKLVEEAKQHIEVLAGYAGARVDIGGLVDAIKRLGSYKRLLEEEGVLELAKLPCQANAKLGLPGQSVLETGGVDEIFGEIEARLEMLAQIWRPEQLQKAIVGLKGVVEKASRNKLVAMLVLGLARQPLEALAQRLREAEKAYSSVRELVVELPDKLRGRVVEALAADASKASTLAELVEVLLEAIPLLRTLVEKSRELEAVAGRIERLRAELIETLSRLVKPQPHSSQTRVVGVEVSA